MSGILFFVAVWSIWLLRNDVVFNGKDVDDMQLFDLIRIRLAWWILAKWPEQPLSFQDLFRFPMEALTSATKERLVHTSLNWNPPNVGTLKFNVDGSSKGSIGGVLRDHEGNILALFSMNIALTNSNEAEILAIKEAFDLFALSRWVNDYSLIIETDSRNAFGWIINHENAHWKFRNCFIKIEGLKLKIPR
ncbi:hypothetical protein COLO4_23441 [Corchorus olitorius]|uniref:RNase H type-1 domain-containing protein n=1 Tax=Corchorus olitorius TaxID=93759 RepID=A0A1R3IGM7_9ROSI|nr:hypothetical protein COLO4_23441 [Corchorus olitorius]